MMFFSFSDTGFYYYFGSILHFFFLIFWIAFIGIQLLEDVMVLKRTKFLESH